MPRGFTAKDERQVKAIKKSCRTRGGSKKECDRIAFATVNKRRREEGRTLSGLDAWVHVGGGCLVGQSEGFPCDDDFKNEETGEIVQFETTPDRHFTIPREVESLREIERLSGVGKKTTIQEAFNSLEGPLNQALGFVVLATPIVILGFGIAKFVREQSPE